MQADLLSKTNNFDAQRIKFLLRYVTLQCTAHAQNFTVVKVVCIKTVDKRSTYLEHKESLLTVPFGEKINAHLPLITTDKIL